FLFSSVAAPILASFRQADPVVVIGAGLAGLRAAEVLKAAGQRVVVLEARGLPGGRVQTIRAPFGEGLHAEGGAIRFSGAHRRVLELVRGHGLALAPFGSSTGANLVTVDGMTVRSPDQIEQLATRLGLRADESGLS